jgi:predicted deacylase
LSQLCVEKLVNAIDWKRERINVGIASSISLTVGRIGTDRPRALIVGGIHGDEQPWAFMAINKMLTQTKASELLGSLTIIPMANPTATEADSRISLYDHLDLNRSFPGDAKGTHTERLAAKISDIVDSGFDLVIDLHGGGSWCVNAFSFKFKGSERFAEGLNAPFIVDAVDRSNTLTGYAQTQGAKVVGVEMGGRCSEEEFWVEKIAGGIRTALGLAGVLASCEKKENVNSIQVGKTHVLRPSCGGIFKPLINSKRVGTVATEGEDLGYLIDPSSFEIIETFKAPYSQTALLLLRPTLCKLEQGAMTYVVAPLYK